MQFLKRFVIFGQSIIFIGISHGNRWKNWEFHYLYIWPRMLSFFEVFQHVPSNLITKIYLFYWKKVQNFSKALFHGFSCKGLHLQTVKQTTQILQANPLSVTRKIKFLYRLKENNLLIWWIRVSWSKTSRSLHG